MTIVRLTPAEYRVARMVIVAGASMSDVARCLGVSPNTAKTHIKHVHEKVGLSSSVELIIAVWSGRVDLVVGTNVWYLTSIAGRSMQEELRRMFPQAIALVPALERQPA